MRGLRQVRKILSMIWTLRLIEPSTVYMFCIVTFMNGYIILCD